MNERRQALVEEVAGAFRSRSLDGDLRAHPSWHDLDEAGREEAYRVAITMRRMEAALDPEGLSTTAHAILARIRAV